MVRLYARALTVIATVGACASMALALALGVAMPDGGTDTAVRYGLEFDAPEVEQGHTARWLQFSTGTLYVGAGSGVRNAHLHVRVASFARPRTVVWRRDGQVLTTVTLPPSYTDIVVPLGDLPAGTTTITVTARPGPQPVAEVTGTDDPRHVALRFMDPLTVTRGPR